MAYGLTTRMFLSAEPRPPRPANTEHSAAWQLLRPEERLKAIERALKAAA